MTPNRALAKQFHDRAHQAIDPAEERYRLFVSAVTADPRFPMGWSAVGNAANDMGLLAASVAAYRRALEGPEGDLHAGDLNDELRSKALVNMALRLHHMGRVPEAEIAAREALAADPNLPHGWAYLSMMESIRGNHDLELAYARRAFGLDPCPMTELALAFALLFNRRWIEGLRHFEARFPYKLVRYESWPMPKWDGAPAGSVMVVCEQGLGDSLSYARFVQRARGRVGRLIFAVQPEIVRLLAPALPGVEVIPYPQTYPPVDAWCAVVSLPWVLGLSDAEFEAAPGLTFGPMLEPSGWRLPFTPGREPFRIGICWGGSPANDIDKWRSIPAEQFLELYRVPGIELYSFQVGERARDMHTMGCAALIRDLQPWLRDVADSAAILPKMDLVITVESFLGHLAGALGLPCWVLYSYHGGDYRLGRDEGGSLWYPRHRVFRQGADAAWGPVWDRVVEALGLEVGTWREKLVG